MIDFSHARWRKSSRSNDQGLCVEVADNLIAVVGVRDSKELDGPVIVVSSAGWAAFVAATKSGAFARATKAGAPGGATKAGDSGRAAKAGAPDRR
jgi:hypothetical protein